MERGTQSTTDGIMLSHLSNTEHDHAKSARDTHNALDLKTAESFQEAHLQNTTKGIAKHIRRKSISARDVRL